MRRRAAFVGLIGLTLILAACSSSHKQESQAAPTSLTTLPTTTTTISTNDAVIGDYKAFWAAYITAADPPNPDSTELAAHATGKELGQVKMTLLSLRGTDQVLRGTADLAPKVEQVNGSTATVLDCYFDHGIPYDATTGAPKGTPDTQRQLVEATLLLEGGTWKVSSVDHKGQGCSAS